MSHISRYVWFVLLYYLFLFINWNYSWKGKNKLVFIDVGNGDTAYLSYDNVNLLIDGGRGYTVSGYLRDAFPIYSMCEIDYVILSHDDSDHFEGIERVSRYCKIGNIILSRGGCMKQKCRNFVNNQQNEGVRIRYVDHLNSMNLHNITLNTLWPRDDGPDYDANNSSVIVNILIGNLSLLFTGDVDSFVLDELNIKDAIDILKTPHHGSRNSLNVPFYNKVNPKYCVISVGKDNPYNHPSGEVLKALSKVCKIYRTDINGSIEFLL